MICEICGRPIGLIHRCRVWPPADKSTANEIAQKALAMDGAGYNIDPLVLTLSRALLAPRCITIGEVEKVARALCRERIEKNHRDEAKGRDAAWLQSAEDASWQYFTEAAKVALKGMGYVEV
jgi:hypothetical protein